MATSSAQYDDCTTGNAAATRFVGAAVVSLNTTGRENLAIQWTGGTNTVGDGPNTPRIFALRLQYRIGTSGAWMDTPTVIEYVTETIGSSAVRNATLSIACNDKPVVQLRWVYYQSTAGAGTRPELRLDDITVSSTNISSGIDEAGTTWLKAFPNPSADGIFNFSSAINGRIFNAIGIEVARIDHSHSVDLSGHGAGVYMLRTDQGAVLRLNK